MDTMRLYECLPNNDLMHAGTAKLKSLHIGTKLAFSGVEMNNSSCLFTKADKTASGPCKNVHAKEIDREPNSLRAT